jgi:hypothetical protein
MVKRLDCFWTQSYRGHYIHGCNEDGKERISWSDSVTHKSTPAKSLHSAKCLITRHINKEKK